MFSLTYAAAILATVYSVAAAAFFIYRKGLRERALAWYLVTAAVWIGANVVADAAYTVPILTMASGIAFAAGGLNIFACLLLIDLLVDGRMPPWGRILAYLLLTAGVAPFGFGPLGIAGTYFPPGAPAQIIPGVLYTIGIFSLPAFLIYGCVRLIEGLRRARDHRARMQLAYVLGGLLLTLAGQLAFDIALPLLGEYRFYELGPASSLFFSLGAAYAILRHKLVDIRLVFQLGVVYTLVFILVSGLYAGLLALASFAFGDAIHAKATGTAVLTVVIAVATLPAIDRALRAVTDRLFFADRYRYADALEVLSRVLYTYRDLPDLMNETERALAALLRAERVRIRVGVPAEEAAAGPDEWVVPLSSEHAPTGWIVVGRKRSGDSYTNEDRQLLSTFAYQAATAFSRAQLFEKTRRHAKELESKVRERTEQLQKAHDAERQMIADLSHALQTPLAVLKSGLERAKGSGALAEHQESLEQSVETLSRFVYDLLSVATLDRTMAREAKEEFSLSDLVREVVEEVQIVTAGEGTRIASEIAAGLRYYGNRKRLREAILTLAQNARKYLDPARERAIIFTLAALDGRIAIQVTDTGIGIPEEEQDRVFERFYRGTNHAHDGTGLGLAIVKRIVTEHGGTLALHSTPGAGSTFSIELPLER